MPLDSRTRRQAYRLLTALALLQLVAVVLSASLFVLLLFVMLVALPFAIIMLIVAPGILLFILAVGAVPIVAVVRLFVAAGYVRRVGDRPRGIQETLTLVQVLSWIVIVMIGLPLAAGIASVRETPAVADLVAPAALVGILALAGAHLVVSAMARKAVEKLPWVGGAG